MSQSADAIVARIIAAPHERLTEADAKVLLAVPDRTLMMEKILAVHFFLEGVVDQALTHAEAVFRAEPNSEAAKNVAHLMRSNGRTDDAIRFLEDHREVVHPLTLAELLCMMHTSAQDYDAARREGTEALRIKNAEARDAPLLTPVIRPFDPEAPRRNVIVFSLWGQNSRYLEGALNNAVVARYLYPGWSVRFYVDDTVPGPVREKLQYAGSDLVKPPADWPAATHGLFWRFLVEDDPEVDIYLVRDADSVMNIKERAAVEDWLTSGRAFHLMRDYPSHCELILAGMWGAHRGNVGTMRARVDAHVAAQPKQLNAATTDQEFLRREIWPIVRQNALIHDEVFDFGQTVPFRAEFHLPGNRHIGQNDWVHRRSRRPA